MNAKQLELIVLYVETGLRVLSARIVLLLTLALTFTLFCWTMYDPTWNRIAACTIFAVLVFLPVIRLDLGTKSDRAVISPTEST